MVHAPALPAQAQPNQAAASDTHVTEEEYTVRVKLATGLIPTTIDILL